VSTRKDGGFGGNSASELEEGNDGAGEGNTTCKRKNILLIKADRK
jgi:hypothetical protein